MRKVKPSSKKTTTSSKSVHQVKTNTAQAISNFEVDNFIEIDAAHNMVVAARNATLNPAAMDFSKVIFDELLAQDGVVGVRIYTAINESGENTFVITGYNKNKNDVYINRSGTMGAIDLGQVCDKDIKVYNNDTIMLF